MAFTKVQTGVSAGLSGNYSAISVSLGTAPAAGSVVVARYVFYDGGSTPPTATVADGASTEFTVESHNSGSTNMAGAGYIGQAYLILPATGHATITVTFSKACGAGGVLAVFVDEFAPPGGQTVSYDNGAFDSGTGTISTPTIPVAGSNELVVSGASDADSVNAATGAWTLNQGVSRYGCHAAHILDVSANTAVGYVGTDTKVYNAIGMSFAAAAGGGQFARPVSDVAAGGWTPSTGTDLFAMVDEVTASDTDYIRSGASPANDAAVVTLGGMSTPAAGTVTLRVRVKYD